jgi:hypothetical protein
MSEPRELRCYEYVNVAYDKVRQALEHDAAGIFERASASATARARDLSTTLWVGVGTVEIGKDIAIEVGDAKEKISGLGDRRTELEIGWKAATAAALFPSMQATLAVYPLSSGETQIDLHGRYRPPLGVVGNAVDALVGHRLAEASVLRFVQDIAARIKAELAA